ncbi:hypothetical protein GE21DRAFT_3572 [Neurospora crassa]|uniref:Ankyrin repeat protein n=1 Tax=Neurospora crassa (strain ATCC 24698 / 74-OR23-1A / CBS 708.71 / DSM 1257 / FGSC 987) TaxID=367110 RepID=Q7SCG9_NEUCR|nr:hypothetical protein NCU08696 [Neurospora crassa OR74A]EAA34321.3 hypothetical protein NCU08696 [Neurospora crassa OR74A]KHE82927.1 hypothetical protein GE21DRAFT_3572 [Neurospora crassa]|eukprot:XP_963557.3 hypothetical protein NCU08696 [Neurospora crassa OR74A]
MRQIARAFVDACSPRNLTHHDPEDEPTSCLSTEPHDTTVEDAVQHYFGCIQIRDRAEFLKCSHPHWEHERKVQYGKFYAELTKTMEKFPVTHGNDKWENHLKTAQEKLKTAGHAVPNGEPLTIESVSEARANEWLEKRMGSVAIAIEAQYKRIQILRTVLSKTPASQSRLFSDQQPKVEDMDSVVKQLGDSRDEWKRSDRFKEGIKWVRQWRTEMKDGSEDDDNNGSDEPGREEVKELAKKQRTKKNTQSENGGQSNQNSSNIMAEDNEKDCTEYHLERDVNAYLIQFSTEHDTDRPSQDPESFLTPIDEPLTDGRFKGTFPDQRISMSFLLDNGVTCEPKTTDNPELSTHDPGGDWNILSRNRCTSESGSGPPKRIRYFHIPSNNMAWVEKAIANYYETKTLDLNRKLRHQKVQTPTHMLLSPQYWRGQQQGTRSGVVHARHMRSLCEVVSTETTEIEKHPKNIVLFMPYLHWETDRRRETISRLIDIESDKFRQKQRKEKQDKKKTRQEERAKLTNLSKFDIQRRNMKHREEGGGDPENQNKLLQTADLALHQFFRPRRRRQVRRSERPYVDDYGRLRVMSALGQYLVDAARLYEAMSTFRDQRMLEKFLFHDPPLHPRRTLDQSHYWTQRNTKALDRDQVVYRDTKVSDCMHRFLVIEQPRHSSRTERHNYSQQSLNQAISEELADEQADEGTVRSHAAKDDVSPLMRWTHHTATNDEQGCDQCKSDNKKVPQLVMVDQLWMWVLDEHTIITSFPERYGSNMHDLSGVHRSIRVRLQSFRRRQVRSVFDLALIVLDECSNALFVQTSGDEGQPQVMNIFSEAIGRITQLQKIASQHVWYWMKEAFYMYRTGSVRLAKLEASLLDMNTESNLQIEVKDIIEELDMMLQIHMKQRDIVKRFSRHVEHILDPECRVSSNASVRGGNSRWSDDQIGLDDEDIKRKEQLEWFLFQYQELLSEVNDRIDDLEGLRASAMSTAENVNDLVALKHQQSSEVQAWTSVRQTEEAVTQGHAVMMFTIVTIVFLPLSFMSSIFGMNNWEFTDSGPMHLGEQFKLMFSISIGIIIATIVVAFSPLLRATVISFTKYIFTVVVVYSQLYRLWIAFQDEDESQSFMRKTELKVRQMKEEVRKAKRKRAAWRAELLHKQNNWDPPAPDNARATSATPNRSWLATNERSEQNNVRPSSTASNSSTQVYTMAGGNTPISGGVRTPEPPLMGGRRVDDGDIV